MTITKIKEETVYFEEVKRIHLIVGDKEIIVLRSEKHDEDFNVHELEREIVSGKELLSENEHDELSEMWEEL